MTTDDGHVKIVTTQTELDEQLAAGACCIEIRSEAGVWLELVDSKQSTVRASDSATVSASDSATVSASTKVAIHLHSGQVRTEGGVVIDHQAVDETDPQTWCDYHGVTVVDGIATVYKAVNDQWTTDRGTNYTPGSTPECPDWTDTNYCGGGLHFGPTPGHADAYHQGATRYVAVGVAVADLRPILGGTAKCKAPRVVTPCVEVDVHGRVLDVVASA